MSTAYELTNPMAARDDKIRQDLARAGIGAEHAQAALDIDAVLQRWRRKILKRELGLRALQDLDLPLDLAQLDVLMAVWAPATPFGDECGGETTVGAVATRLNIDPSRASRLTAETIRKGWLRRGVSQEDARRAVLELTPRGLAAVEAVQSYKFLVLGSYLKDWAPEEIATFLPLLERFSEWSERAASPSDALADEIAALRETVRAVR